MIEAARPPAWPVRLARRAECDGVARVVEAALPDPWSARFIAGIQASERGRVWVALDAGGAVGGALVEERVLDEAHLLLLVVHPALQRRGVGTALLRTSLGDARRSGTNLVYLEVRASNLEALGFYRRFGFESLGRRTRYYRGGEDALLLWLPLEPAARPGAGASP